MKEENVKCYTGKKEKACCHYNQKYQFKLNKYVQSYIDEILKISLDKCISKFIFVHFYIYVLMSIYFLVLFTVKKQETKVPFQHEQPSVHAPWSTANISVIKNQG